MLVSGFWHGPNWQMLLWGAIHGFYLVAERLVAVKRPPRSNDQRSYWPGWASSLEELVIESYYGQDISFNSRIRMNGVTQLLIPLEGTHADQRYLFFGAHGDWRAGAMVLTDDSPLRNAMRELGYLPGD
jgi:hypothetical protein